MFHIKCRNEVVFLLHKNCNIIMDNIECGCELLRACFLGMSSHLRWNIRLSKPRLYYERQYKLSTFEHIIDIQVINTFWTLWSICNRSKSISFIALSSDLV